MWWIDLLTLMSIASTHKLGGGRENMFVLVMEIEYEGVQDVSVPKRG